MNKILEGKLNKLKDELKTIGELGKRYVTSQKNPQKQCEKIKNMMEIVIQK